MTTEVCCCMYLSELSGHCQNGSCFYIRGAWTTKTVLRCQKIKALELQKIVHNTTQVSSFIRCLLFLLHENCCESLMRVGNHSCTAESHQGVKDGHKYLNFSIKWHFLTPKKTLSHSEGLPIPLQSDTYIQLLQMYTEKGSPLSALSVPLGFLHGLADCLMPLAENLP